MALLVMMSPVLRMMVSSGARITRVTGRPTASLILRSSVALIVFVLLLFGIADQLFSLLFQGVPNVGRHVFGFGVNGLGAFGGRARARRSDDLSFFAVLVGAV